MTITEVFMPQLGVNDDVVKLDRWTVERGDKVVSGQEIASLETSKASFSLEAEVSGYIYPIVENGREVPVRSVLAVVLDEPDDHAAATFLEQRAHHKPAETGGLQFTAKARELAEKSGVDISRLPQDRVIRERDVMELLERKAPAVGRDRTRIVAVYGASQGGITVVDTLRAMGGYEVAAFLDDTPGLLGTTVSGLAVWSGDELERLADRGVGALASHIAIRPFRLKMRDRALAAGLTMLNVIHPRAFVSSAVQMGVGNVIKAGAVVDSETQIGDCCIIDNGVIVPHHCVIHNACHLAPGVTMGGGCSIGEQTLVGVGSSISSRIRIGRNVLVRPGSVVVSDIEDDVVIGGDPAKVVGKRR
jgi:UDP-perosamine 4-acetyltransferase